MPITSPRGKYSSDIFLKQLLFQSPYQKSFLLIIKKIRDAIGPWNTVWGVKLDRGTLTWELYFYNHCAMDSRMARISLFNVFRSYFKIPAFVEIDIEHQPYLMFSVDLSDDVLRSKQIDSVHLYMNGWEGVSQGNSYYWGGDGVFFENHYDFFYMPQETQQLVGKVKNSIVLAKDWASFLKHDLVRKLMPCYKICVAHKKNKDGVYFSRVNVAQLLYFLEYFSYPVHIVDFIKSHQKKLDHLLYDVAFDCTGGPLGPVFSKGSFYGVF